MALRPVSNDGSSQDLQNLGLDLSMFENLSLVEIRDHLQAMVKNVETQLLDVEVNLRAYRQVPDQRKRLEDVRDQHRGALSWLKTQIDQAGAQIDQAKKLLGDK